MRPLAPIRTALQQATLATWCVGMVCMLCQESLKSLASTAWVQGSAWGPLVWLSMPRWLGDLLPLGLLIGWMWTCDRMQQQGTWLALQTMGWSPRRMYAHLTWDNAKWCAVATLLQLGIVPSAYEMRDTLQHHLTIPVALLAPHRFHTYQQWVLYHEQATPDGVHDLFLARMDPATTHVHAVAHAAWARTLPQGLHLQQGEYVILQPPPHTGWRHRIAFQDWVGSALTPTPRIHQRSLSSWQLWHTHGWLARATVWSRLSAAWMVMSMWWWGIALARIPRRTARWLTTIAVFAVCSEAHVAVHSRVLHHGWPVHSYALVHGGIALGAWVGHRLWRS